MTDWTTPAEVERRLRKRWDSGAALRAFGEGAPWSPVGVALRGPTAQELAADLERARSWARSWQREHGRLGRLEYRRVGGRLVGVNELPAKLWVDSYAGLWRAVGTKDEAERFAAMVSSAREVMPRLVEWMIRHPMRVLELESVWDAIVDTVGWIERMGDGTRYVRQIDIPGVDTKFVERHRSVIGALLDAQLHESKVNANAPRTDIAGRYGFLRRPAYVRVRDLSGFGLVQGHEELTFRRDELAERPLPTTTVYVIENETTYLAFPRVDDAVAVFGGGYAASVLDGLDWLADRDLVYWGDIDTHGFAILDRVRRRFPHTRSMLMDRATLLAHDGQWVREEAQHVAHLEHLSPDEGELYHDLVEDALGPSVRLEQERIWFPAIEKAISTTTNAR